MPVLQKWYILIVTCALVFYLICMPTLFVVICLICSYIIMPSALGPAFEHTHQANPSCPCYNYCIRANNGKELNLVNCWIATQSPSLNLINNFFYSIPYKMNIWRQFNLVNQSFLSDWRILYWQKLLYLVIKKIT